MEDLYPYSIVITVHRSQQKKWKQMELLENRTAPHQPSILHQPSMAKALREQHLIPFILLCTQIVSIFAENRTDFVFNDFQGSNLRLDGDAVIHPNGLLQLTNFSKQQVGHAFYPLPLSSDKASLSFSTTFAFAMYPEFSVISGHGIMFAITPSTNYTHTTSSQYMGLFNSSTNGLKENHIFAVELDTIQNLDFGDIDSNHVGIDVNSLRSNASASAQYYSDQQRRNESLNLISGKPMQIWVDYDANTMVINVTMAPLRQSKPSKTLLTTHLNLSDVVVDPMYVGFSSSTGSVASKHYVLGWSFSQSKEAQPLDYTKLPRLPPLGTSKKKLTPGLISLLVVISSLLIFISGATYIWRKKKYEEVMEDWEQEYIIRRFSYKDLYKATNGFAITRLLGAGGFGKVYQGVLPATNVQVAVKRVSHESGQGMKEFVAEIASMSRLRHRNLVQLLGYCRRKRELLLVYEYMSNGSLDKFLFSNQQPTLNWNLRSKIIKGVASALYYLHEEWEQVVLHRDIKASNILLDGEMNPRLGDFGLARLYDHEANARTTHVVGTVGYLAPELARTGKPTTKTNVFAFGTFMLEVACGKRPVRLQGLNEQEVLTDWVIQYWKRGAILDAVDPRLAGNFNPDEAEMILKLGLVCTNARPEQRPSIGHLAQILHGNAKIPEVLPRNTEAYLMKANNQTSTSSLVPYVSSSFSGATINSLNTTNNSVLQYGR